MAYSFRFAFVLAAPVLSAAASHAAITITPTANANTLAAALATGGSGITVTNAVLSGNSGLSGELSSGTFAVSSPPDTYTFTLGGIVLSTGDVAAVATGPNTTPCDGISFECVSYFYGPEATVDQEALLDPITGNQFIHYDVTQLDLTFDVDLGVDTVYFRLAFGSDEYPIFFETEYNDGFGLYLNGVNQAFVDASPINISHPNTVAWPGTELNGLVLDDGAPAFTVALTVTPGSTGNDLTLIIGDASDEILDTAVYVAALGTELPPGAIFLNGFPSACETGWSGDVGFVPNCVAPSSRDASSTSRQDELRRRALVADYVRPPRR